MIRIAAFAAVTALAAPAFAQDNDTLATDTTTTTATIPAGDWTFDLDSQAGASGVVYGDYEEASAGEADGPDVTFDLE